MQPTEKSATPFLILLCACLHEKMQRESLEVMRLVDWTDALQSTLQYMLLCSRNDALCLPSASKRSTRASGYLGYGIPLWGPSFGYGLPLGGSSLDRVCKRVHVTSIVCAGACVSYAKLKGSMSLMGPLTAKHVLEEVVGGETVR